MDNAQDDRYLAYFLGPKGENADLLTKLVGVVLDDYAHWRRNYYPADQPLLPPIALAGLQAETSQLHERVLQLIARLRRSFPFYSPRYIAHQQSETSIPSILGGLAGMLYNSNNVTSESGAVTLEYEIEACNRLLTMLGFTPPPDPPEEITASTLERYHHNLAGQYGWCHLTSGGTVANIEALWVARTVTYFPLAVADVARRHNLDIQVKLPSQIGEDDAGQPIIEVDDRNLVSLRPNEAIYLLKRFFESVKRKFEFLDDEAAHVGWKMLRESEYSLANGVAHCQSTFPPAVFASSAAHYSIRKAADLLGIGAEAVVSVDVDSRFRLDVRDLRMKIDHALKAGRIPLAVIGVVGTTEEGAVDPVHRILSERERFEERDISFWVHVDGAWGAYFRTLLRGSSEDDFTQIAGRLSGLLHMPPLTDPRKWVSDLFARLSAAYGPGLGADHDRQESITALSGGRRDLERRCRELLLSVDRNDFREAIRGLRKLRAVLTLAGVADADDAVAITARDRAAQVADFVEDGFNIELTRWDTTEERQYEYRKDLTLRFNDPDVIESVHAMCRADSVTVDPHKMGYVNYPCGAIAFRNDWIRYFIRQKAPYITSIGQNTVIHQPPRHLVRDTRGHDAVATEAFAAYTLEGSRPSFPATALWLSTELLPLDRKHHGRVVRASWLSARELYEWIIHWDDAQRHLGEDPAYELVPFATLGPRAVPPDTNIVTFGVRKKGSSSIRVFNALTASVYHRFSIQAERGQREYSYSQPFFLSRTTFDASEYSFGSLEPFLSLHGFNDARHWYEKVGLTVLRATVMNPYLHSLRRRERQNMMLEFVRELARVAEEETRLVDQP